MPDLKSPFLSSAPVVCMITGGNAESSNFRFEKNSILERIELASGSGVRIVQIREKMLTARLLCELSEEAMSIGRNSNTAVLVNERFDIALATGASGVHLTSKSLSAREVRRVVPEGFLIGVSVHSIEEAKIAASGGADYAMFGPVFDTPSKRRFGKPQGIAILRQLCEELKGFPVIAVGGIDQNNIEEVLATGAAGIAAIRLFEKTESIRDLACIHER